ncbi:MAG: tetratricopeptide repeat protein, partial [Phycisphaerae bacterium]
LVAEVLYNMAVAEYRLGRVRQAAARFVAVARDHPDFDRAARAATFAVQLTAELQRDAVGQARPGNRPLYRTALELLVHRYADAEAARYWRFYLGQLLEESGDCEAAAREYSGVDASHELFLESRFAAARCMARVLQSMSDRDPPDRLGLQQRSGDFFAAASRCHELAGKVERDAPDPARLASLKRLTADLRVTTAEVLALPLIDRAADALEALLRFEEEFPQRPELIGRVWRVRVLAYERLQRLDEAARAIPEYVAADPAGAGATLQSLYVRLVADAARSRRTHDEPAARRKAEMALLLARQIDRWARRPASDVSFEGRRAAGVQLAEANLRAGRVERAGELFSQLRNDRTDAAPAETGDDLRIAVGFAEAAFQRGDFAGALPEFNRLATTLPPTDPVRWKSLLRDLQCRTRLGHPPRGIIRVIEQQRFLHHDLGGPEMAPRYEKLQRENQRRLDAG